MADPIINIHWGLIRGGLAYIFGQSPYKTSLGDISEHLRVSICKFQKNFLEYHVSASKAHTQFLKNALSKEELNKSLDAGLKKFCDEIMQDIAHFFISTHNSMIQPRVSLHLATNNDELFCVVEANPSSKITFPKKICDFTILEEITALGRPYLDNDIPDKIKKNQDYKHINFDIKKIRNEYKKPWTDIKWFSRIWSKFESEPRKDDNWMKMSKYPSKFFTPYKSHIAIPITFREHTRSESFKKLLSKVLRIEENGQSILGFIFVDHINTYYFHNAYPENYHNIDINCMVVYADLLSLFIATNLMFRAY